MANATRQRLMSANRLATSPDAQSVGVGPSSRIVTLLQVAFIHLGRISASFYPDSCIITSIGCLCSCCGGALVANNSHDVNFLVLLRLSSFNRPDHQISMNICAFNASTKSYRLLRLFSTRYRVYNPCKTHSTTSNPGSCQPIGLLTSIITTTSFGQ